MRKPGLLALLFLLAATGCSHGGRSGVLPAQSPPQMVTPESVSPGLIAPAPMAHTEILPPSAMKSPLRPDIAISSLSWSQIPGTASFVAASSDGSLWALSDQPSSSTDKYIWHYASGSWTNISGLASRISAAPDGSLWAINSGGGVWHYSGGSWTSPGGGASNSIAADSSGGIYVFSNGGSSADKAIWHYSSGAGWVQQNGSGTVLAANLDTNTFMPGSGTISPGGVYILSSTGGIWYENTDKSFAQLPASASALAPTTVGGVFALGYPSNPSGNQVYYFDLNTPGWSSQSGAGLLSMSANSQNLYLTSSTGAIYAAPLPSAGPFATATISGPSASVWTSVTIGTPVTIPLTVTEKDANGVTITGTYANPIRLVNLDSTHATLNTTTVSASGTSVTVTYDGSSAFTGTRIRVYVDNVSTTIPFASFLVRGPCNLAAGVGRAGYYPCDLQSAYNLTASSSSSGSNQTVAIVDAFDDPSAESDLAIYRAAFGLPACTSGNGCFTKRAQDGSTNYPSPDAGWAGEISLDLDMVSAICPNCHILLVEANDNSGLNLYTAENEAVALGATEISNSWGGPESASELVAEANFNHPGIPITASSGDDGYGVSYPAASGLVTAVGGTKLTAAVNGRGWSEVAWTGAGSGCSSYVTKPSWQTDTGCTKRMVADVSAVADPATAVWTYDTYQSSQWGRVGGTSVSSPIIASVYAISGNASTVIYGSFPYSNPGALFDITSGTNSQFGCSTSYFCTAGPGYDGPTGLGTPNGATGAFIRPLGRENAEPLNSLNYHPGPSRRLCSTPRPGYFACFAIVRTD